MDTQRFEVDSQRATLKPTAWVLPLPIFYNQT
jgi:hypothetical protein